ncbi:MAG: glycosyltransferase family 2 protein [Planctomycetota bacterium]
MGAPARLTACIIALNEADRLGDCLASVAFCDEVVVVDSGSTDGTQELARQAGARVLERPFDGFGPQKNFAVAQASHDWVLCLDADERISDGLRARVEELRDAGFPGGTGWEVPRLSNYLGTWVRYGWYPDLQLRLYDRRRGSWGGNPPHEKVAYEGPVERLEGDLLHFPYRSFEEHLGTIDRYTTVMAENLHARGRRSGTLDIVLRPPARFLRFYVQKRGFLLGWRGLLLAYLAAHYVRLKYAKLRLLDEAAGG